MMLHKIMLTFSSPLGLLWTGGIFKVPFWCFYIFSQARFLLLLLPALYICHFRLNLVKGPLMLALSAHNVEMNCVFIGPRVIPADSILSLFPGCVTPSQRMTSGACWLLWFNRNVVHGLAGVTGAKHKPRLIVHAIPLCLCAVFCLSVSSLSSREIKRLILETGEICNKIDLTA